MKLKYISLILLLSTMLYSLDTKIIEILEDTKEKFVAHVSAETVLGDAMTVEQGRKSALLHAKRTALESAGMYVKGSSKVENYMETQSEISSKYSGMVKIEPITSKVISEGKYNAVYIEVKATIDRTVKFDETPASNTKSDKVAEKKQTKKPQIEMDGISKKGYKFDVVSCEYDEENLFVVLKVKITALKKDRRIMLSTTKPSVSDIGKLYLKKITSSTNTAKPADKLVQTISEDFPAEFTYYFMSRNVKPNFLKPIITFQPYQNASEQTVKFKNVKIN